MDIMKSELHPSVITAYKSSDGAIHDTYEKARDRNIELERSRQRRELVQKIGAEIKALYLKRKTNDYSNITMRVSRKTKEIVDLLPYLRYIKHLIPDLTPEEDGTI